ncbi:histidinol-phosphate transaminase [Kocuria sp. TGY1127_2]|uniref:histidinol-phosphate transaminase n=1 Tax=Kocuria sp. TGY1127_2 TaxID=2711328 RepID=UPI0015C173FF|nr:histidinol-phosphate transaminase [Kocuria sp. TGY1127_2]
MSENLIPHDERITPRHVFSALPKYAAGKPPRAVEGLQQYKLSSNENPFGPVPAVQSVIQKFSTSNRYPDPLCTELCAVLGRHLGVDPDDIVTGAGSLGALAQILAAFAGGNEDGSQDEVIYPWRSFEAYPIVTGLAGAKEVRIPNLANGEHDLDAMADAITDRTKVVILCTPNNPTGPALTKKKVQEFMAKVPSRIVVVLDEAYLEFCQASELNEQERSEGGLAEGIDLYPDYPNLVLLRTFSKAAGLAGLRVGYSISHPEVTQYLRVSATTFAVTKLAEEAAIASVEHADDVEQQVRHLVSERTRVVNALEEQGWDIPTTRANFVWLPLGEKSQDFAQLADENALSVRAFQPEGVRVSIGEDEANSRFIRIAGEFLGNSGR